MSRIFKTREFWLAIGIAVMIGAIATRAPSFAAPANLADIFNNTAILMISSELPEVLGMADRVLVMHEGRLTGELSRAEDDEESVIRLATGQVEEAAA